MQQFCVLQLFTLTMQILTSIQFAVQGALDEKVPRGIQVQGRLDNQQNDVHIQSGSLP